jgi:hypothetical protein
MSTTNSMLARNEPQPPQSVWHGNKFVWVILVIFIALIILYLAHKTYQAIRFRREQQQQQQQDFLPSEFERNWGDAIPLQQLQRVFIRSNDTLPSPQYEEHAVDLGVPEGVKLEQRGKYHYVVKDEVPPTYTILEQWRPSGR